MDRKPLQLRYYGDPTLRRKADAVETVDPETRRIIEAMFDCMYRERGIGLAAPQVGIARRIFVVDVEGEGGERTKLALVNPEIKEKRGSVTGEEGCLSIPGIHEDVKRHAEVVFEGLNERGERVLVPAQGLLARALQHELDHLDGIACGIDLFDCVLPTRNARNGMAFTSEGPVNIRNAEHARSDRPLDPSCGCEACATFTRAYLRHLHLAQEILAHRMLTLHNVTFYQTLMAAARRAIERGDLPGYAREFSERYLKRGGTSPAPA